jgi:hypothetical protein
LTGLRNVAISRPPCYQHCHETRQNVDFRGPRGTADSVIRGQKVILANDLAELYGVTTKALNQAVRRNSRRFPADFLFQLTREEKQEVVTNCDHLKKLKFSPQRPFAFTEHGAIMAATILNSQRAVDVSVLVVRAFVRLGHIMASDSRLAEKFNELERKVGEHDVAIQQLVAVIRELLEPPSAAERKKIGFRV